MSISQLVRLIRRDGPHCHYCGKLVTKVTWSRDHVVPQSLFGPDVLDNMVLAHQKCNGDRGNKIDKCWCDFCRRANERWLDLGFQKLATARRTNEERMAVFREIWDKRVEPWDLPAR